MIESGSLVENVIDARLADRQGQEFVQDDPLIMPANLALGQFEDLVSRLTRISSVFAQMVDDRVMKTKECCVELSKDHVFVVPAISEDGGIVAITREIETDRSVARDDL